VLSGPLTHRSRRFLLALIASAFLLAPVAPVPGAGTAAVATAQAAAQVSYAATIADARAAAQGLLKTTGASSMSVALVDGNRIVWSQAFGVADRSAGTKPTDSTMYGIGSVSKMFVTMAVMKLVDAGKVSLDTPVVDYLPAFSMADPGYREITVRMLLDHSAGLPGSDYYNTLTTAPYPGYMTKQFLAGLAMQRLKTTPGSMSVYCNDCFTLAELVVGAVSGESYAQFVTDELFAPLGMTHSRFPTEAFADGTYAHAYTGSSTAAEPQEFVNLNGSGGVWSTPRDMAHVATMLMAGGVYAGHRILSTAAVAEMGRDQVRTTLDPAPLNALIYGLGWDTVRQAGLAAVGVTGWMKGGDTAAYHAGFIVAPGAHLSAVVESVGYGINSANAEDLAERMILHALVDDGTLGKMPAVLGATKLPARTPTAAQLGAIVGVYGAGGSTFRVTADAAGALTLAVLRSGAWAPLHTDLRLRSDGAFWASEGHSSIRAVTGWGRRYLDLRSPGGYGHYRTDILLGERVLPGKPLSVAWQARVGQVWLLVTEIATSTLWGAPPTVSISDVPDLPGYVGMAGDGSGDAASLIDPGTSDTLGAMFLVIPTAQGRDLADVVFMQRGGEEWLRTGSAVARPKASVPVLATGANAVTTGTEGYGEWRSVAATSSLAIAGADAWKLYDAHLAVLASGVGAAATVAAPAGAFLEIFSKAGGHATVTVTTAP